MMRQRTFLFLLCLRVLLMDYVSAFPNGAPAEACNTLSPTVSGHVANPSACPLPCPFFMEVREILGFQNSSGSTEYHCGSLHRTFVSTSNASVAFRGFFTQSRESTPQFDPDANLAGAFVNVFSDALWQTRHCDGSNAGATHTDRIEKNDVNCYLESTCSTRKSSNHNILVLYCTAEDVILCSDGRTCTEKTPNPASCQPLNTSVEASTESVTDSESIAVLSNTVCARLADTGSEDVLLDVLTVAVTSLDVTATGGSDYIPISETLSFLPGDPEGTLRCVDIVINNDSEEEDEEQFVVILGSSSAVLISDIITVNIVDDDFVPVFGFVMSSYTIDESLNAVVEVCASLLSEDTLSTPVTINVFTGDMTANAFLDYLPLNNAALLFSVGSTQGAVACVNIGILNDDEHEDDETFRVLITGLSGVATVDPCRMLTTILIRQNDMPISFTVQLLDPVVFESQGTVTVVVSANSNPTQRTLVTVTTNPVTALVPQDLRGRIEVLEFNPGDFISLTVDIQINDDLLSEGDETFNVEVSTNAIGVRINNMLQRDTLRVTIVDNEILLQELITPISIREDMGPLQASILLSGTGELIDDLPVMVSTQSVSATSPEDFVLLASSPLVFPVGSMAGDSIHFSVNIVNDNRVEGDETFMLQSSDNNPYSQPSQNTILITIEEDDFTGVPVVVGFQLPQSTVPEGATLESCVEIFSGIAEALHVVQITTVPISASTNDFQSISQTVTFDIGSVAGESRCTEVNIASDNEMEDSEDFHLILFQATLNQQITIDSERMLKLVTIDDVPGVLIGLQGGKNTVTEDVDLEVVCVEILSQETLVQEAVVDIFSIDGSAVSCDQADFIALSATVTFSPGETKGAFQCVYITILEDTIPEDTETFTVSLDRRSPNVNIANNSVAVFRITDVSPVLSYGFESNQVTVRESDGSINICVEMLSPGPLLQPVTLQLIFNDGRAVDQDDYSPTSEEITFFAGNAENISCVSVDVVDDDIPELSEQFTVTLKVQNYGIAVVEESRSTLVVIIEDDDGACIGIRQTTQTVSEDDGEVMACVELQRPDKLSNTASYTLSTQDGTALDDVDYVGQSGSCSFPVGSMSFDIQCLYIPIIDNNFPDGTRHFTVSLMTFDQLICVPPGQAVLTVMIIDNDLPQVKFERSEYNVSEGDDTVEVCVVVVGESLSASANLSVGSESGTATADEDFVSVALTLALTSGTDGVCFNVDVIDDTIVETDQSFTLELSSSSMAAVVTMGGEVTTVTINDNDVTSNPTVSFKDSNVIVREGGNSPVMMCVQICPGNQTRKASYVPGEGESQQLHITTKPGTANAGEDYTSSDIYFTIFPDISRKFRTCAAVSPLDDNKREGDEEFSVCLSDMMSGGVTLVQGAETLRVTIEDNEVPAVGFQVTESSVNEDISRKFTCVDILYTNGPLESDVVIEFYTQDGSAEAPNDYEALMTTLTFREGADGSLPSDAECVGVFIFDDALPEDTESLSFRILSPNTSAVRIMEGHEWKRILILDDDMIDIGLDRPSYSVMENVGDGDLGLMVCATILEATFNFTALLIPQDGSAKETVDYRLGTGRMDFFEAPGSQIRCVCIQVIDDCSFTGERSFNLTLFSDHDSVRPLPEPVSVLIMDDEGEDDNFNLRWINDSPRVSGDSVAADFSVGSGIRSLTCSVTTEEPVDCSSGSVVFPNLSQDRIIHITFEVIGTTCNGSTIELSRRFRRDHSQCSAHLINDGVTVSGTTVVIQWQGTGPSHFNQNTDFTCSLDGEPFNSCSSLESFTRSGLSAGTHQLIVRPVENPLCTRRIGLRVSFIIKNDL